MQDGKTMRISLRQFRFVHYIKEKNNDHRGLLQMACELQIKSARLRCLDPFGGSTHLAGGNPVLVP